MILPFMKLEGLGNCYVFVEARKVKKISLRQLARAISNVSSGIGSDGVISVDSMNEPHSIRFFNKDGSEAESCGNGMRQAALYIRKKAKANRKRFILQTVAGNIQAEIINLKGNSAKVRTGLGSPDFSSTFMKTKSKNALAFDIKIPVAKHRQMAVDCVSLGNPHAIIWVNNFDFDWEYLGQKLSNHPRFKKGANVHFCRIVTKKRFQMRIYERGSGITMACGSGAAACLAAGVMKHQLDKNATALMPGGNLTLTYDLSGNFIYQEGPVSIICSGEYNF